MLPKIGDRIELLAMPDDPSPIEPGTTGTVTDVTDTSFLREGSYQVSVNWDSPRSLMLVCPPDRFRIIRRSDG